MVRSLFLIVFSFILLSYATAADKKPCTKEEAFQAETDIDNLNDWDSVYHSFKRFAHCDDGAISEGYSDDIGRLLANDWKHVKRFHELCLDDKQFQDFVLKHIDDTISVDVLQKIIDNARLHCPSSAKKLCRSIEKAASAGWEPEKK